MVALFLSLALCGARHGNKIILCGKNGVYGFYFASCMNIIFNELRHMIFIQRAK